ncbi:uncharacterized protein N7446_002347 [Penicillium canescens]|uniref:Uncharacterized protein n=1 Tax=Penicillium canescens TaxID=5083 RepID=A0AAD6IEL1_PENCN|nr:uncharacterized protein N7446_002347 [Penicillium canescens]KAJ6044151.1 hypothetical protein N7460_005506 [Penicillium canescens]KAJ6055621.1 hypothetical protein N7444_004719 [Penicillium canescens]KAJ6074570.1 hypothetical protein N7446_002347 [Penicillium canescens]
MSEGPSDSSNVHLGPPSKTTELQDPGAEDNTASESGDEYFSDASEGQPQYLSSPQSGRTSPVPRTRVERVDSSAQHGEVPGTSAFEKREQDAVPDEIEVVPEGETSSNHSPAGSDEDRALTPGGSPIPRTVVEKVDPEEASHGEVPGTSAHEKRLADAVPDVVIKASDSKDSPTPALDPIPPETDTTVSEIPETRLERVDSVPAEKDTHPQAHQSSPSDPLPDSVETVPDASTSTETFSASHDPLRQDDIDDDDFGEPEQGADDFDEFVEEQDDMGDDDFGDFDDGFQEPSAEDAEAAATDGTATTQPPSLPSVPPLIDFDTIKSTSDLLTSLQGTLDNLLPATQDLSTLLPVESIPDSAAVFSTERSLSLWSQLVAPPPLQPQNWVKSRIRRLFLVSLGVPVDLDEILPASKQKKLILPSIDLEGSGAKSPTSRPTSQPGKEGDGTADNAEKGQASSRQKHTSTSRRGAPPPPEMDLSAVRRLCATTDAALSGLTDLELESHVKELEQATQRASSVLEHWLKRRDGLVGEKEAFEGVIENLVSHVRRVRK